MFVALREKRVVAYRLRIFVIIATTTAPAAEVNAVSVKTQGAELPTMLADVRY